MAPVPTPDRPAGGSDDDPFSWLYQRGHPAPSEDMPPPVPPTVSHTPHVPPPSASPPTMPSPRVPTPSVSAPPPGPPLPPPPGPMTRVAPPGPPPYTPPPVYQPVPPPPEPPRRRGLLIGLMVGLFVVVVVAGLVVAFVLRQPDRQVAINPTAAPSSSAAGRAAVPTAVSADCTAPPATDDGGHRVSYDAANVLDTDLATAWRCDGSGTGRTLTFTFPAGTTITRVGLVNGYVKTDPTSGAQRYGEYRRITKVMWQFDDGSTVSQRLKDNTPTLQSMAVPPVASKTVVLTIEDSTKPGRSARSRDAVLISEVAFG